MARRPFGTIAVILTLAICMGWIGALVGLFNAYFLKPLPVPQADRVVRVFGNPTGGPISYPNFLSYREQTQALDSLAAFWTDPQVVWDHGGSVKLLRGTFVSANFFETLRPRMSLGAYFREEVADGSALGDVVVISERLWQTEFAGAEDAVGTAIRLNNGLFTVIGVLAREFEGLNTRHVTDLWLPVSSIRIAKHRYFTEHRGHFAFSLIGRLAPRTTAAAAQTELRSIAANVRDAFPEQNYNVHNTLSVVPQSRAEIARGAERFNLQVLLLLISGTLLAIACANVINVSLSNVIRRRGELGVMRCLGARGIHVYLPFVTEAAIVAAFSGALGFAMWQGLVRYVAPAMDMRGVPPDVQVIGFIAFLLLGLIFLLSIFPYVYSRRFDLNTVMKQFGAGVSSTKLQRALLSLQIGLSTGLLVVALLFIKSLDRAWQSDFGFHPKNMVLINLNVRAKGWSAPEALLFIQNVTRHLESVPGVESVGVAAALPLNVENRTYIEIDDLGGAEGSKGDFVVDQTRIGPNYLRTMGMPLMRGRYTTYDDHFRTESVQHHPEPLPVIVNETFVRRYYPGVDPIHRIFYKDTSRRSLQIVGVVADVKTDLHAAPSPGFYLPFYHSAVKDRFLVVHVRGAMGSRPLARIVEQEVQKFDHSIPIGYSSTIEDHLAREFSTLTAGSVIIGALSVIGILLAAVGTWALFGFELNGRQREIAIRIAVGASRGEIFRLVAGRTAARVTAGYVGGVLAVMLAAPWLGRYLYGAAVHDLEVQAIALAVVLLVAGLSVYSAMRRVSKWQIAQLLRDQ